MPVVEQQLLRGVAANITAPIYDTDGDLDTGETVTVGVTRADGTTLIASGTATTESNGLYSVAATAAQLEDLDLLTATWSVASVVRAVTVHEVVGGFYFSVADLKGTEKSVGNIAAADLRTVRAEVEAECERIVGFAFVPRYSFERLDGTGTPTLQLPVRRPRTVRSVTILGSDNTTETDFTATALAAVAVDPAGYLHRTDGSPWTGGRRNVIVGWEHGLDQPPADIRRACLRRARTRQNLAASGIPDRATFFTADNGATYRIAMPGVLATGDPEVDAVYARYAMRVGAA